MAVKSGGLHRPRSTFVESAEHSMKRFTNIFNASETKLPATATAAAALHSAPSTPPLLPELPPPPPPPHTSTTNLSSSDRRPRTPLSVNVSSVNSRYSLAPPDPGFVEGYALTPTSSAGPGTPSSFLVPPHPQSPGIAPSLNFSRSDTPSALSGFGSRPGTSSGYSLSNSGLAGATPAPPPPLRQRKKRNGRFGKKNVEHVAWRLAAGSSAHLEPYDVTPLLKGEPTSELWYDGGDTLVYLTSLKNAKSAKPVFRIYSCPTMFQCLGKYIVEDFEQTSSGAASQNGGAGQRESYLGVTQHRSFGLDPDEMDNAFIPERTSSHGSPRTSGEQPASDDRRSSASSENDGASAQQAPTGSEEDMGVTYKLYYPVTDEDLSQPNTPSVPTKPNKGRLRKSKQIKTEVSDNLQRFIDARNLFAFFCGHTLVASQTNDLPFEILMKIWNQLGLHEAENNPGDINAVGKTLSTQSRFDIYIDDLKLDDVRNDDDAIVEALVLGEKWRSVRLYSEGFIHAAGRWEDIDDHPGLNMVSTTTKTRLDRASHDIRNLRLVNIRDRIPKFELPSVWVGEGRYPEYKTWRNGYDRMRTLVINHVNYLFGSWPPKAGKRGRGGGWSETGGLNRVVLQRLYNDLCCVYDLTVDREWLHGDRIHFEGTQGGFDNDLSPEAKNKNERHRTVLLKIQEEFDICSVPVQPKMPFNTPRLPYRLPSALKKKKLGLFSKSNKKVRADEIDGLLKNSYNEDSLEQHAKNGLVMSFIEMERNYGLSKPIEDLVGARRGAWIFMYCILQTLVVAVVDGQASRHGSGVEYFLCSNVKGVAPWEKGSNRRQARTTEIWGTGSDGGLLSTSGMASTAYLNANPNDEIEMMYRRSHCWQISENWRLVAGDESDGEEETGSGSCQDGEGAGGVGEYNNARSSSTAFSSREYMPDIEVPPSPRMGENQYEYLSFRHSQQQQQQQQQQPIPEHECQCMRHDCSGQSSSPASEHSSSWGQQQQHPVYRHSQYRASQDFNQQQQFYPEYQQQQPRQLPALPQQQQFDFDLAPLGLHNRRPSINNRTALPPTQGMIRKSSAPVSGSSSPLRNADGSPRGESPVPGGRPQQQWAHTLPRRA